MVLVLQNVKTGSGSVSESHYPPLIFRLNCEEKQPSSFAKGHLKLLQQQNTNRFCFRRGNFIVKSAKKKPANIFERSKQATEFGG